MGLRQCKYYDNVCNPCESLANQKNNKFYTLNKLRAT